MGKLADMLDIEKHYPYRERPNMEPMRTPTIRAWLKENINEADYLCIQIDTYFKNLEDAVLFKMRWG